MAKLTQERVERIVRSHACVVCREYSYKKVIVKRASAAHKQELNVRWRAVATCGVCGTENEVGVDEDGSIVYAG